MSLGFVVLVFSAAVCAALTGCADFRQQDTTATNIRMHELIASVVSVQKTTRFHADLLP